MPTQPREFNTDQMALHMERNLALNSAPTDTEQLGGGQLDHSNARNKEPRPLLDV